MLSRSARSRRPTGYLAEGAIGLGWFIGIDIGGTFTDCVLWDQETATLVHHKQLTSARAPEEAVAAAAGRVLAGAGVSGGDVDGVLHATTLATNAILERRGARVGFITTEGFRDIVIVGREHRYDMQDLLIELAQPLVRRADIVGIRERVGVGGDVLEPLDEDGLRQAVGQLADAGCEALAVGFLHSWKDPRHERRARELAEEAGLAYLSVSHEIAPAIREYERFSTAIANAYVQPLMDRYLSRLAQELHGLGLSAPISVMLSNGGLCAPDDARAQPVRVIESGPAAGVMGAARFAAELGIDSALSVDMGGTTAKGCIIQDGAPGTSFASEVARLDRYRPGSGIPLSVPSVDLIEIGAGGGSIASVDEVGRLRVGPRSAGADPGPACYGLGGLRPTVTDADLLLGYLNPEVFAGGAFSLDLDKAKEAIERDVARPLGVPVLEAAWGIHTTVNETMASAFRMHAIERGVDIRSFTVIAFGGAGPVHGCALADTLGSDTVVISRESSVFSALGLIETPPSFEAMRTFPSLLADVDWQELEAAFSALEAECMVRVERVEIAAGGVQTERSLEMRYLGQQREVLVPLAPGANGEVDRALAEAFEREYRLRYSQAIENVPLEVVNMRVRVTAAPPAGANAFAVDGGDGGDQLSETRKVWFGPSGPTPTPCLRWPALAVGSVVDGPACVEDSTTVAVVQPGWQAEVKSGHNLVLRRKEVPA